jgi:hypothetical protein
MMTSCMCTAAKRYRLLRSILQVQVALQPDTITTAHKMHYSHAVRTVADRVLQ